MDQIRFAGRHLEIHAIRELTSVTNSAATYRHSLAIKENLVSSGIIRNVLSPKPLKQVKYRNKSVILVVKWLISCHKV